MIVIDTSALVAVILKEAGASSCEACLRIETERLLSAGTMAEALIVAARKTLRPEMETLIAGLQCEIAPVTAGSARRVADAYDRWGKGVHRAGLNFGDCFAYELAKSRDCPLLFIGDDFSKTDIRSAM